MKLQITFSPVDLLKIYIEDFYGKEGYAQESHIYTYSKVNAKMISFILKSLEIEFTYNISYENSFICVHRCDYEELLKKTGMSLLKNTINEEVQSEDKNLVKSKRQLDIETANKKLYSGDKNSEKI